MVETLDVYGRVVARKEAPATHSPARGQIARALKRAARQATECASGPVRLAVVSVSEPVDRRTGRLVDLPDAPFLFGALSPATLLAELTDGPVLVDNDVNWAARAEQARGRARACWPSWRASLRALPAACTWKEPPWNTSPRWPEPARRRCNSSSTPSSPPSPDGRASTTRRISRARVSSRGTNRSMHV